MIIKTVHITNTPLVIANPYIQYPQDGVPPANPAVTLPVATSAGSSASQPATPSQTGGAGQPGWLWLLVIAIALAVALLAIGLGLRFSRPAPGGASGVSYGMTAEDLDARKRRERALQDLTRRQSDPEGS